MFGNERTVLFFGPYCLPGADLYADGAAGTLGGVDGNALAFRLEGRTAVFSDADAALIAFFLIHGEYRMLFPVALPFMVQGAGFAGDDDGKAVVIEPLPFF